MSFKEVIEFGVITIQAGIAHCSQIVNFVEFKNALNVFPFRRSLLIFDATLMCFVHVTSLSLSESGLPPPFFSFKKNVFSYQPCRFLLSRF